MKTPHAFFPALLMFCVALTSPQAREDVSRPPLAPKTFAALPKLETEDQIHQAMGRVKSINIKRYRSLKKLKEHNMQQFLGALSEFLYENDPELIRQQRKTLLQTYSQLRLKLTQLTDQYRKETDENAKKQILSDITQTAGKLIQVQLDQDALVVKLKKQEAALLETQLEAKRARKNESAQALVIQNMQEVLKPVQKPVSYKPAKGGKSLVLSKEATEKL